MRSSQFIRGRGKFCSIACRNKAYSPLNKMPSRRGPDSPNWRGGYIASRYVRTYKLKNPEKVAAHRLLGKAIREGKVARPQNCWHCGKECKPDGHHENYAKPLKVTWLCRQCHVTLERAKKAKKKAVKP